MPAPWHAFSSLLIVLAADFWRFAAGSRIFRDMATHPMCLGRRQAEPCLARSGRLQAKGRFYSLFASPERGSIQRRLYADVLSCVLYTTNLLAIGPPERNLEVSLTHLSAVPFLGDGFLRKLTAFLLRKEPLWSTNSRVFVSHRTVKAALK